MDEKKEKTKVVFSCYFCEKIIKDAETELAVDDKGKAIISGSKRLTDADSHFICKECWTKVKKFCNWIE